METLKPNARLGDILTQCGLASASEIEKALAVSKAKGIRLGEALVQMGVLSEDKIVWALGVQFQLSYVDVDKEMVDWDWLQKAPLDRLKKFRILPLAQINGRVHVVVADPTVSGLVEVFAELFPEREVEMQLADARVIEQFLDEAGHRVERANQPANLPSGLTRANLILNHWMEALGGAKIHHLAALPNLPDENSYRILSAPEVTDRDQTTSRAEVEEIFSIITNRGASVFERERLHTFCIPGSREAGRRPIRGIALTGISGHLLAFEGVPLSPPPLDGIGMKPLVLAANDPLALKALLYREVASHRNAEFQTSPTPPILALEVRSDHWAEGLFQVEIPMAAERLAVMRLLTKAVPQALHIVEVECLDELEIFLEEPIMPDAGVLIFLIRQPNAELKGFDAQVDIWTMTINSLSQSGVEQLRSVLLGSKE